MFLELLSSQRHLSRVSWEITEQTQHNNSAALVMLNGGYNLMCPDELFYHYILFVPRGALTSFSQQLQHGTLLPSPFTSTQTLCSCSSEGVVSARHAICWAEEIQVTETQSHFQFTSCW